MSTRTSIVTAFLLITLSATAQQTAGQSSSQTSAAQPAAATASQPAPAASMPPAQAQPVPAQTAASAQPQSAAQPTAVAPTTMDQVVDRTIEREHALMSMLKNRTPLVETYLPVSYTHLTLPTIYSV